MKVRGRRCMAGLIVCAAVGASPLAAAPDARSAAPTAGGSVVIAGLDVALRPRAALWRRAWNPTTDTYADTYAKPTRWSLRLDACRSTVDGFPIPPTPRPPLSWTLEPLDGQHEGVLLVPAVPRRCSRTVPLPALGRWRVTPTLRGSSGTTSTDVRTATFRDVLVAAVGDSFASGEGNRLDGWVDKTCHRSRVAWPAQVAERLENATTAVTFLSFACSGAEVDQVSHRSYQGIDPDGDRRLPPQLSALRTLLGDPLETTTRPVDVLLGVVGVNDMAEGAGSVLGNCAVGSVGDCRQNLSADVAGLAASYDRLEIAISAKLRLRRAYFLGYPSRIFTDAEDKIATCGAFYVMSRDEALWLTGTVDEINREIALSSLRNGWSMVGTKDLFRTHGFCADKSPGGVEWFRGWSNASDRSGVAHPNFQGQRATAAHVAARVRLDGTLPEPQSLTVRFLEVRITDRLGRSDGRATVGLLGEHLNACGRESMTVTGVRTGQLLDVSANPCARWVVRTAGRAVGVRIRASFPRPTTTSVEVTRLHRRRDGWDATPPIGPTHGVQRLKGANGGVRYVVQYEVTAEPGSVLG